MTAKTKTKITITMTTIKKNNEKNNSRRWTKIKVKIQAVILDDHDECHYNDDDHDNGDDHYNDGDHDIVVHRSHHPRRLQCWTF